jgi:hypothetical protein
LISSATKSLLASSLRLIDRFPNITDYAEMQVFDPYVLAFNGHTVSPILWEQSALFLPSMGTLFHLSYGNDQPYPWVHSFICPMATINKCRVWNYQGNNKEDASFIRKQKAKTKVSFSCCAIITLLFPLSNVFPHSYRRKSGTRSLGAGVGNFSTCNMETISQTNVNGKLALPVKKKHAYDLSHSWRV